MVGPSNNPNRCFQNVQKPADRRRASGSDSEDSTQGLDDNGNPTTIAAAQRLFHKNKNPIYCAKPKFYSAEEAH